MLVLLGRKLPMSGNYDKSAEYTVNRVDQKR